MQRKDNKSKTKKKVIFFLLIIGFLLFLPVSGITQEASVPDSLYFGDIDVGESASLEFFIHSTDLYAPLIFQTAKITSGSSAYFTIPEPDYSDPYNPYNPQIIPPGETHYFDVFFMPEELGLFSGIIEVVSNDHDTPILYVPISGRGITAAAVPEPATLILFSAGLIGLVAMRKIRH